jgi:TolB-like protein
LAVLPFEIEGLSPEEGVQVRQQFVQALQESMRYNILPLAAMRSILEEAGLKRIETCNTPPCLAQLGKILGVEKVVYGKVARQASGFALRIQLLDASDASRMYDESLNYAGEFSGLLAVAAPEQGRKLGGAQFGTGLRWYVITAAVLVGVGVIYWIYTTFASTSSTQTELTGPAPAAK